jgi:hypothetical protein
MAPPTKFKSNFEKLTRGVREYVSADGVPFPIKILVELLYLFLFFPIVDVCDAEKHHDHDDVR